MIERALLAVLLLGAALVIASIGERFHPIALAANAISSTSCASEGWGDEACAAER